MGNWNLTPIGTLTFNDPETWWPMTATLYLDGTLDVVAGEDVTLSHTDPEDGCYEAACDFAQKLYKQHVTPEIARAHLETHGIDTADWQSV